MGGQHSAHNVLHAFTHCKNVQSHYPDMLSRYFDRIITQSVNECLLTVLWVLARHWTSNSRSVPCMHSNRLYKCIPLIIYWSTISTYWSLYFDVLFIRYISEGNTVLFMPIHVYSSSLHLCFLLSLCISFLLSIFPSVLLSFLSLLSFLLSCRLSSFHPFSIYLSSLPYFHSPHFLILSISFLHSVIHPHFLPIFSFPIWRIWHGRKFKCH